MTSATFSRSKFAVILGASLALTAVIFGAFGSHGLEGELTARNSLDSWRIGVRYAMWHALALLVWAGLREAFSRELGGKPVMVCMFIGTLLFSGSIFALSLGVNSSIMGPITPIGGVLLIVGWASLLVGAWRA